jgi:hypothetical protein
VDRVAHQGHTGAAPRYRVERAFPRLTFREPVFLARTGGIERWLPAYERRRYRR